MARVRLLHSLAILCVVMGCAAPHSPTAPSASPSADASASAPSQLNPGLSIIRDVDLSGDWIGTYTIPTCWPAAPPNPCAAGKTGSMAVTLVQKGTALTGTFQSDLLGAMNVTGSVNADGSMNLSGAKQGLQNCFSVGDPIIGDVARVGQWATRLTRNGTMSGTLTQFTYQRVSSCYFTYYEYYTAVAELRRDPIMKIAR